jgi:FixJ family two-component response regulator
MNNLRPTIFVVDDEMSMRKALARLLEAAGLAVATYACAQDYIDSFDPAAPGCLLLDLAMPGMNGLALQKMLATRDQRPPIIFLTGQATIADTVRALKGGAVDFITKPVDDQRLIEAVRKAVLLDVTHRAKYSELTEIRQRLATLTPRERQVLSYVVAGKLNKQTASELGTVEKTIKVHRARVMEKLQARSLARLIQIAALAGISSTP